MRPIPDGKGYGFFSMTPIEGMAERGYRYENVGRYHNYYFTPKAFNWPVMYEDDSNPRKIDGFSPNLNKELHVGHLRNLALANSFAKLFPKWESVAILGSSLGYYKKSLDALTAWFEFVDYKPRLFFDTLLPWDNEIVPRQPGTGKNTGAMVWINPEGKEVVVMRSSLQEYICTTKEDSFYVKEDQSLHICPMCGLKGYKQDLPSCLDKGKIIPGRPNYVFHDIAFAATIGPDYYITGAEQVEHFRTLGMASKHLPMGLVLGTDGKKLKSRTGDALSADEALNMIQSRLDETPESRKLAWNIAAWNFLHVNRGQDVRFDPETWTAPDSPGLYIAYTYARLHSALAKIPRPTSNKPTEHDGFLSLDNLTDFDVQILGYASYATYWLKRSQEAMDTAPLANYVHDLCRVLTNAYNKERIADGRSSFQGAITQAFNILRSCMKRLGLFPLQEV